MTPVLPASCQTRRAPGLRRPPASAGRRPAERLRGRGGPGNDVVEAARALLHNQQALGRQHRRDGQVAVGQENIDLIHHWQPRHLLAAGDGRLG